MKPFRKLGKTASVLFLALAMAGCGGGGHSDADLKAAEEKARAEAEAAAAEAARKAAEAAERAKQEAVAEAERKAAEAAAAASEMARATVQKAAIAAAVEAAETALGMVVLGASDADIAAAEAAIQAITAAIEAAVDVDDTSMYRAQVTLLNGSLATATGLVHQDRAAKKMARADAQKGTIAVAIEEAKTAVAAIGDATEEDVAAAATTAGEKVQAAKDAIAAAVDVDDTSMYATEVDGIETSVGTAATMARGAYQSGKVTAALSAATTAVGAVELGATDDMIEDAAEAIQMAKDAIAAAVDVDDTSMYTATVNSLESTLTKTVALVEQDRATNKMARAVTQKDAIADAIAAAQTAVKMVIDGVSDEVIEAAETAIQDARDAIADAADVDDTSMYATTVNDLATGLAATKITVLANRAAQDAIDDQIASAGSMATDAMNAAKTAADNAKMAAEDADTARTNIATMQTNEQSGMHAKAARDHAKTAMDAYMDAKAASEAANAATTVAAAVKARVDAEAARDIAQAQETMADADKVSATGAVDGELFIDGTMKKVGGVTIDAGADRSVVTTGTGDDRKVVDTGLQADDNQPMSARGPNLGRVAVRATATVAYKGPRVNAEARTEPVGKLVDSSDDMARLMIITKYMGDETVKVFAIADAPTAVTSTRAGRILVEGGDTATDTTDDVYSNLTSLGEYYQASGGIAGTLEPADQDLTNEVLEGDTVSATAQPRQVYSYVGVGADGDLGTTDDVTLYVILDEKTETTAVDGTVTTTYSYHPVSITIEVDRDARTVAGAEPTGVTAELPVPKEYKHIHFGVWAGLGEAAKNGSQEIAGLGIGFVQNYSGEGETGNMPLQGEATYNGNWVATIQAEDVDGEGDITLRHGPATIMADFEDDEIEINLVNLAMLKGDLTAGSSAFSGDADATGISGMYGLDASGNFEGSFSGAFYGSKAAEVGGVFDYSSDDMEEGAFRGAFGGDKN